MLTKTTLERVKDFLVRLVKDSDFAAQVEASPVDRLQNFLEEAGYAFSQADFETATIQILELKERDEFCDLTEAELIGAVGGWTRRFRWPVLAPPAMDPIVQPLYGVVVDPPASHFPRPQPQPRPFPSLHPRPPYSGIIEPPTVQPLYGVVIDSDLY